VLTLHGAVMELKTAQIRPMNLTVVCFSQNLCISMLTLELMHCVALYSVSKKTGPLQLI